MIIEAASAGARWPPRPSASTRDCRPDVRAVHRFITRRSPGPPTGASSILKKVAYAAAETLRTNR